KLAGREERRLENLEAPLSERADDLGERRTIQILALAIASRRTRRRLVDRVRPRALEVRPPVDGVLGERNNIRGVGVADRRVRLDDHRPDATRSPDVSVDA